MQRFLLATAAAFALSASPAFAQAGDPFTITEVDHVGNRITVSGPGVEDRIVDLDDAALSSGVRPIRIGDLHAGDQVMIDGTLSGTRLSARSVRVVPPATPPVGAGGSGDTVTPNDTPSGPPDRMPTPRNPSTLQPGAPIPPPTPGGAGRP
jgi:hypothetical protein